MNAPTTDDKASGAKSDADFEVPLDHNSSYIAIGKSRVSARGVGFLILCVSVPSVMLFALYLSATYEGAFDKDILMILVGAYATAIGSAITAYFQQKKAT